MAAMEPAVVVREATTADAPVLAEIERNAPLVFADGGSVAIDRGDDYFAASRLMGGATVMLAEVDGEPAGAICGAIHGALVGGVERRLLYVHHGRILPAFQRMGLGHRASYALMDRMRIDGYDSPYWYVAPGNTRSQNFNRNSPGKWGFGPTEIVIPCLDLAGPPAGREARPEDAAEILHILNTCHAGEELFLPYTLRSLHERLERDPRLYGWSDIWIGNGAVLGVWRQAKWVVARYTDAAGNVALERGAAVLDYGCLPGAQADLGALIQAWCGHLVDEGMTELSLFSSPGTCAWPVVANLQARVSQYDLWTPNLPEPEGARSRGIYVDHIYF